MLLVAMLFGIAPDGGWFMYPPLTGAIYSPGINTDFWLIGITFVEISAIAAAVEITVSILKYRAPGMSLDKMPIFAWYALITALMILTGFPPLILGSVLLEVERAFGLPFFQAELGGDSLLWQHLFWLFGHPEVYIIFLPAAGVISTVLPVMCRTTLLGYGWIVAAARGAGVPVIRPLGPSHVHHGHPAHGTGLLLSSIHACCRADGGADFRVDRHHVERPPRTAPADAAHPGFLLSPSSSAVSPVSWSR